MRNELAIHLDCYVQYAELCLYNDDRSGGPESIKSVLRFELIPDWTYHNCPLLISTGLVWS